MSRRTTPAFSIVLLLAAVITIATAAGQHSSRSSRSTSGKSYGAETIAAFLSASRLSSIFEGLTNATNPQQWFNVFNNPAQSKQLSSWLRKIKRQTRSMRRKLNKMKLPVPEELRAAWNDFRFDRHFWQAKQMWWKLQDFTTYAFIPFLRETFQSATQIDLESVSRFAKRVRQVSIAGMVSKADMGWRVAKFAAAAMGYVRGELYTAMVGLLLLLILQPLFLDWLLGFLSPLVFLGGAFICGRAVADLGLEQFSIWPAPGDDEHLDLVTEGVYAAVRHPFYAGLVLLALGFALWTRSPARLFLVAGLGMFLMHVIEAEEKLLIRKFPYYSEYSEQVENILVPGVL